MFRVELTVWNFGVEGFMGLCLGVRGEGLGISASKGLGLEGG